MVNRVDKARSNRDGHAAVRHQRGVVHGSSQGIQVTLMEGVVDALEFLCLRATFLFRCHILVLMFIGLPVLILRIFAESVTQMHETLTKYGSRT